MVLKCPNFGVNTFQFNISFQIIRSCRIPPENNPCRQLVILCRIVIDIFRIEFQETPGCRNLGYGTKIMPIFNKLKLFIDFVVGCG